MFSNCGSLHTYIKPSLHQTCPRQFQKLTISSGDSVLEVLTEVSLQSLACGVCVSSCFCDSKAHEKRNENVLLPVASIVQVCLFTSQSVVFLLSKNGGGAIAVTVSRVSSNSWYENRPLLWKKLDLTDQRKITFDQQNQLKKMIQPVQQIITNMEVGFPPANSGLWLISFD